MTTKTSKIFLPAFTVKVVLDDARTASDTEFYVQLGEFWLSPTFPRHLVGLDTDDCRLGSGFLWLAYTVDLASPATYLTTVGKNRALHKQGGMGTVAFVAGKKSVLVIESVRPHGTTVYRVSDTNQALVRLVCSPPPITGVRLLELMAAEWAGAGDDSMPALPMGITGTRKGSGLQLYTAVLTPQGASEEQRDQNRVVAMARAVSAVFLALGRPVLLELNDLSQLPSAWPPGLDEAEKTFWASDQARKTILPFILQSCTNLGGSA